MDIQREKSEISKSEIRKWAVSLSIVLSIIGGVLWYKGNISYSLWIWALAAIIFTLSLIAVFLLKPVYKGWLYFTHAIGWIIRMFFLVIIYYIICMPIGFFLRLSGKDLLDINIKRREESYWKDKKAKEFDPKEYERQY